MPEYIKIGFTHGDVKDRLKQLDRTGTPLPFEVYYAATVEDAEKEEEYPFGQLKTGLVSRRIRCFFGNK